MFGENNKKEEATRGKVETILGNGTRIEGDISTNGSLRIEGEVVGKIKAKGDLFIGESGKIKNEIEARNIIIAGTVAGNVVAHNKLELLPSSTLSGDVMTETLKIEEGARFVGSSKVLNEKSRKKEPDAAKNKDSNQ